MANQDLDRKSANRIVGFWKSVYFARLGTIGAFWVRNGDWNPNISGLAVAAAIWRKRSRPCAVHHGQSVWRPRPGAPTHKVDEGYPDLRKMAKPCAEQRFMAHPKTNDTVRHLGVSPPEALAV